MIDNQILENIKLRIAQGQNQLSEIYAFNTTKQGVIQASEFELFMRIYIEANDQLGVVIPYNKQFSLLKRKIEQEKLERKQN